MKWVSIVRLRKSLGSMTPFAGTKSHTEYRPSLASRQGFNIFSTSALDSVHHRVIPGE